MQSINRSNDTPASTSADIHPTTQSRAQSVRENPAAIRTLIWLLVAGLCLNEGVVRADTLYVSNYGDGTISRITSDGVVSTFATVPREPYGLAFDSHGYLYVACAQLTNRLYLIGTNGLVAPALTLPQAYDATGMTFDSRGRLYVASQGGYGIGRTSVSVGSIGPFGTNRFSLPFGVAFDRSGDLFVGDFLNGTITRVGPDGTASPFKGGMPNLWGIAFDASGNLYAAVSTTVKKIAADGSVTNFAAGFSVASGLAFGTEGDLYVADQGKNTVERVTPEGVVSTFATGLNHPLYIAVQPDLSAPKLAMEIQTLDDFSQNGARFTVSGGINCYYQILHSTDLTAWTPFQTNQIVAGSITHIVDPGAPVDSRRFYRAHLLP